MQMCPSGLSFLSWKELGKRYITDLGYQPVAGMDEILFSMSMEQGAAWLKRQGFTLEYSEERS